MVEDRVVSAGQHPAASVRTGAKTPWLMATIVFRAAGAKIPPASATKAPPTKAAKEQAAQLRQDLKAFTTAHDAAAKQPVLPLSKRPRTHALAGQINTFVAPTGDFTALYYCLVTVADQ
jgi:hypothetical protein